MKRFALFLLVLSLLCGASAAEGSGLDRENNHRVFYEIFVSSFSDSNGDGTGDLRGIINRLDYLNDGDPASGKSLGIEGIWLTPIFLSPSYHKYDVTDYYQIDPRFGTEEDLRELVRLCHERDVKLILDLPLNHTGSACQWFQRFRTAHAVHNNLQEYYDYYSWIPEGDPVPAGRHFEKLAGTDILYECNFDRGMPELNFDNEKVQAALLDVASHWLALGVDGFRFDAAKYPYYGESTRNVDFWCWYMEELRKIDPCIYTVGEVWDEDGTIDRYLPAFNCFRFSTAMAEGLIADTAHGGDVNRFVRSMGNYLDHIRSINPEAMCVSFIANHDTDRAAGFLTVASGDMQMAANLYLLSPGSPFIYYGEEIGLRGSRGGASTDVLRPVALPPAPGHPPRPSGDRPGHLYPPVLPGYQGRRLPVHLERLHRRRVPQRHRQRQEAGSFPDSGCFLLADVLPQPPGGGMHPGGYHPDPGSPVLRRAVVTLFVFLRSSACALPIFCHFQICPSYFLTWR